MGSAAQTLGYTFSTGPGLSLASAIVDGIRHVTGDFVCVLDADLQHPPNRIVPMLEEARRTGADIIIASRYIPGGSAGGLDGPLRRFYSVGLKEIARAAFPRRLARVTDPLGGFFLVRREVVQGVPLRPVGYKILLEVLIRTRWRRVREVPYQFRLRHLGRLAWSCSPVVAPARRLIGRRHQPSTGAAGAPESRTMR